MNLCHVVSVGRLDQSTKHVEWLLKAWRLVQDAGARARLWIVGSGPDEGALQRTAADLDLGATCRFLGAQPNGIDYLAAADIVAMTSLFEAQGMVPIEAMACGRPVVANHVDGVRDSFSDGFEGFLVPPFDVGGFAERLLTLIRSPELRRKMGEAGRISARRFDHRVLLERRLSLYQSLLSCRS